MSYQWDEHIAVAEHILAGGNYSSEAATRNAISRAYYAAFCHLRNWAEANTAFRAFGDAEDHGRLTDHFRTMGQRDVAAKLDRLRGRRNQCDYDNELSEGLAAPPWVRNARELIAAFPLRTR